jgi:tripartite-type tricarboxylate transporter receptor subunit TctC
MVLPRRKFLHLAASALALPAVSRVAKAQAYPSKAITIVVPFAAGGPSDALARLLGERMRSALGQPLTIENVAGASGTIGVGRVVRAAPDGYTIGIGHWSTHVLNGAFYQLPYNLLKDLEPITMLPANPAVIIIKKGLPANNLKELISWLKVNPDKASAGTAGGGTDSHVTGVFFQGMTDTRFNFVPYRGTGPALNDLVAGHIDLMFDQASNSIEQVRGGTVRALAVTSKSRLAAMPDIPTVDEAGVPGLYNSTWYGFWAPKGTPKDIVAKLNAAAAEAMADPAVRKRLGEQGLENPPREQQTPEALGAHQKAEIQKWWPIIKAANIRAE